MVAEVHRHETGKLQEAGIYLTPAARIMHRNGRDHILFEPRKRPFGGQRVHRRRRLARVDRAAHHGQRFRAAGMVLLRHDRRRSISGHRRLADGEHMRAGADLFEKGDDVIDIIVEIEPPFRPRNQLRVAPVGNIHLMLGQHAFHRAAQQRGIMARHRRHDQQLGRTLNPLAREALQLAEGLLQNDFLENRDGLSVHLGFEQAKARLATRRCCMCEHIKRGRKHRATAEIGKGVGRVLEELRPDIGEGTGTGEQRTLQFIGVIEHDNP